MGRQHRYWVVSPNVKDDRTKDQKTVEQWKDVIRRECVAIMGWSPEDKDVGHGLGPKFAYDVQRGDVVLIARRKYRNPDVVGFGIVSGEVEETWYRWIYDKEPAYVRKLRPCILLHEAPRGIPFHDVLKCTWAMHELHPDRDDSARKVCAWMDQQLELTNREGNDSRIREKPLDKNGPKKTYDYEVRTGPEVRTARRNEEELLYDYKRWLEKQGRKLSRLQIGRNECDAWEAERQNLIEAKATVSRQDIRMAVGQLLDYAHQIGMREDLGEPRKAILLPEQPHQNDVGWVQSAGIYVIWRSGRKFRDNAGGLFT